MIVDKGRGVTFKDEKEQAIAIATDRILDTLNEIEKTAPGYAVPIAAAALAWQVHAGRADVFQAIDSFKRKVGLL
jgi:hypothetical protein